MKKKAPRWESARLGWSGKYLDTNGRTWVEGKQCLGEKRSVNNKPSYRKREKDGRKSIGYVRQGTNTKKKRTLIWGNRSLAMAQGGPLDSDGGKE